MPLPTPFFLFSISVMLNSEIFRQLLFGQSLHFPSRLIDCFLQIAFLVWDVLDVILMKFLQNRLTSAILLQSVPDVAVEIIIAAKQETAALGECDGRDATDDVVMRVHSNLLVRANVKQEAGRIVRSSRECVSAWKVLRTQHCNDVDNRGVFSSQAAGYHRQMAWLAQQAPHVHACLLPLACKQKWLMQ